ncbi:MAG: helix-turn-helix transcriptional regulator [Chitinophagaceae bacterium]
MLTPTTEIPVIKNRLSQNDQSFLHRLTDCLKLKGKDPGFGVKQLARSIRLSPTQLNRRIVNLTGHSSGRLLTRYRMHTAQQLLIESQEAVKQIAWQSGFQGHTHFCRSFYREFRCTPSRYRSFFRPEYKPEPFRWQLPLREKDFIYLLGMTHQQTWLAQLLRVLISYLSKESLRVEQLASALYISPSGLNRKIKETFGVTSRQLIRDMRLQHASELLAARAGSVAEVAYEAGFFDHAHFCHCFRSVFGCAPSAYKPDSTINMSLLWLANKLMVQNGK